MAWTELLCEVLWWLVNVVSWVWCRSTPFSSDSRVSLFDVKVLLVLCCEDIRVALTVSIEDFGAPGTTSDRLLGGGIGCGCGGTGYGYGYENGYVE